MKYLVISGCVTVSLSLFFICLSNNGTTEPDEPNTLPNLTMLKLVWLALFWTSCFAVSACKISSAKRLVAPITLVGLTALSVDIKIKASTPVANAALEAA